MFNVARSPTTRYDSLNGLGASFVADPLATSVYDNDVDPWSGVATPELVEPSSGVHGILGNAQIPPLYTQAWNTVDALSSGSVSINSLQRVISTANIAATSTEQIVNLVTSKSKVNKSEFYVALALVALSQQGKDATIEAVVTLAKENQLPIPNLDTSALNTIAASTVKSTFPPPRPGPVYNSEPDPWTAGSRGGWDTARAGHATASILTSGLPPQWWKGLEQINITIFGQQGPFFNRYTVYSVHSFSRGAAVHRRYSDFAFLWDVLVRRYPFRILPQLPPKRIGPDESFIEQRRKGLIRFLNFIVNHPVIKDDGVLTVFLSEPDFEGWKRRTPISYDEEATAKRVDRMDEMSIPSNLGDKLAATRQRIGMLIEQWTRICTIAERVVKRREAAASDIARTTLSINALTEGSVNSDLWGLPNSQLAIGVRLGMEHMSAHLNTLADTIEQRSRVALNNNLEALKMQRDLYVAVRDLFSRHDRYSQDNADRLRKRVETQSLKLENIKAGQGNGWESEAEKLTSSIEKDRAAIVACLARRVFIRSCLWHEFRVVYHNREHALLSIAVQTWATQERDFNENTLRVWNAMVDSVQTMPYE